MNAGEPLPPKTRIQRPSRSDFLLFAVLTVMLVSGLIAASICSKPPPVPPATATPISTVDVVVTPTATVAATSTGPLSPTAPPEPAASVATPRLPLTGSGGLLPADTNRQSKQEAYR